MIKTYRDLEVKTKTLHAAPSPLHPFTPSPRHLFTLSLFVVTIIACGSVNASDPTDAEREFTLQVLPLLKTKCFACHGDDPKEVKGDFDVRSRETLLTGGESGEAAVVPGNPEASPLYRAVKWEALEMPPKENDRLNSEQVELIRRWIAAGAPWPDEAAQRKYREAEWVIESTDEGVIVKTSGGLSESWTYRRYQPDDLWAFRKVEGGRLKEEKQHPVDFLIQQRLTQAGFKPAPPADPRTLIRRATFDLIGLPPTPEDVDQFLAAWKQNPDQAWSELIDRLLDSPHYGERWGQHWLDVTRYADTGGMANDYERSNMWRYRDYVIRSFNDDKPYDQFVIEQLAGDELADESVRQRSGGDENAVRQARLQGTYNDREAEMIVASGFLRLGAWDNAMVETDEARQIFLDDLVNNVGQTFLSTGLRCCKCHDHKFDPIPTRDYYRIYAAFSTTQMAERPVPFLPSENCDNFAEGKAHVQRMLDYAVVEKNKLIAKREAAARAWFAEHNLPYKDEAARTNLPDEAKPPRHVGLDYVEQGQLKVREQDEWIWTRAMERYEPMAQSVYNAAEINLAWNGARKLRIDTKIDIKKRPESFILTGGALTAPGDRVEPGVLSATGLQITANADDPYLLPNATEGRRLALAKWIADPRNPLAARSIVNRVWQHHFGYGVARNPNNFGAKGAKPTHPELLDWLAADFVEHGWKIKRLHRLIMLSDTYRQASSRADVDQLRRDDPNNELLAYFPTRRLTAEELRDTMLFVTGEVNETRGGLPIMPEINMEVALQPRMIQFSLAPAYQPSPTRSQRNRRTIYAYRVRGQADPFLELFNQPNPNESCEARDAAAVTPQAFTLLNSDVVTDRSIAFASRLEVEGGRWKAEGGRAKEEGEVAFQIQRAFALALGREPTAEERSRMVAYVTDMQDYHQGVKVNSVTYPTAITRSLVEELSGQPFEYTEILPVFERYEADKKAADVPAETRALADFCLLLFNSNEFMFLH